MFTRDVEVTNHMEHVIKLALHAPKDYRRNLTRQELWLDGYFLDEAGILWAKSAVPAKMRDGFYYWHAWNDSKSTKPSRQMNSTAT